MSVLEIGTLAELELLLKNHDRVVVDFSAPSWCIPCQRLAPHYEAASERLEGKVLFVMVDFDTAEPELVKDIMSVPTVLKFKGGNLVGNMEARTALKIVNELDSL